jgi:hypothetical protein
MGVDCQVQTTADEKIENGLYEPPWRNYDLLTPFLLNYNSKQ